MSMINALAIVTKLQNRVWVDAKITSVLESLWEQFDSNYQEFSSFDKWQKQVEQQHFSWSTVHTEKFWRENAHCFSINAANLELIAKEISFLNTYQDDLSPAMCEKKAVICYDLGEFARFYMHGREYLQGKMAKSVLATIMGNKSATPELKKEAITAYQKILMKGWGQ